MTTETKPREYDLTEIPAAARALAPTATYVVLAAAFSALAVAAFGITGYQVGAGYDVEALRIVGGLVALVCAVWCGLIAKNTDR